MRFLYCVGDAAKRERLVAAMLENGTRNIGSGMRDELVSVEPLGEAEVFNIQTETGNYVANGYAAKNCQILQNPKADATHGFKREWLERWTPDKGVGLNRYILRDAANSKKDDADFTVDWVLGLGEDENVYVLAVYRDRLNLTERTSRLFELHRKWKPIETRYEEYGMQGDIEHVQGEMVSQKYRFKIVKVGGRVRKEERIKRLIPFFENHRIILPHQFHITTAEHETKDMIHEFVENEYMAFPVPVHDDMLDSLARLAETEGHVGKEKVKLTLKWPAKKPPTGQLEEHRPHDPGMGY
jgi:predicted phage terminase large subunit-like protein